MPWKEPGDKPREPRSPGSGGGNKGTDLEAQWKRLRGSMGRFGGGPGGIATLVGLVVVLWFAFGSWTLIDAREVGVVLRFGQFQRMLDPGLHARLPRPFEEVLKVDTGRMRTVSDQMRMLTSDEQIAMVDFYVQYKVTDARRFLFAISDAEDAMRQATIATVRAQVGRQTMQELTAKTDNALTSRIHDALQHTLDGYGSGIDVAEVGIQNVSVPSEVKDAFDDIGNARQDAQQAENAARAEVAKDESGARTQVAQLRAAAAAYKTQRIARAQGETARFNLILGQYRAAPDVTRRRLSLEMMEEVLGKSRTVIDDSNGRAVIQLPPATPSSDDTGGSTLPAETPVANPAPAATQKSSGGRQ